MKWRHVPQRAVTGAFILQSGIGKWNADEATAARYRARGPRARVTCQPRQALV